MPPRALVLLATQSALLLACTSGPAQVPPAPVVTAGCETEAVDAESFTRGQQQIVHLAAEAKFGTCPPTIPFECEMAMLEGALNEPRLYTVRFRSEKPWQLPPHSHPRAERVTVLKGRVSVGFGPTLDKSKGQQFSAGDYYVNAPGAVHYVWADEPIEIQITGIGPWEVHPHAP